MNPEKTLLEFVHLLRQVGLRISTAEVMDALTALSLLGFADRERVKVVLKATLVKEIKDLPAFEEAFSAFFASPADTARIMKELENQRVRRQQKLEEAEKELVFQGAPIPLSEEDKLFYARLPAEQKAGIRHFLEETSNGRNVDERFRPLVAGLVRSHLAFLRRQKVGPGQEAGDFPPPDDGRHPLAVWVEQRQRLWTQDLQQVSPQDLPKVQAAVAELSRRLAVRISRRYRRVSTNGAVDLRRSLRGNLRYGGVLFKLRRRRKRWRKPQLVLLCDVSGSMARYSSLTIQFLYGLSRAVRGCRCFLFAERAKELDLGRVARRTLGELAGVLEEHQKAVGHQTRLDAALEKLVQEQKPLLVRRNILWVVSDTKTQNLARAVELLAQVRSRVREVLWLNPLPEKEWDTLPSVAAFRRLSRMYSCHSVADLEKLALSRTLLAG